MDKEATMKKIFTFFGLVFILPFLVFLSIRANAQENYIRECGQRPACTLGTGISWSAPTQTWLFTPIQPNVSLRIWVHNNNTTNAHTAQTLTLFITDSTTTISLVNQGDFWVQAAVVDNSTTNAKCSAVAANNPTGAPGANGKGTCYSVGMYAAQIAVRFNPGGAQAGSPDTFDIGIVQQPSTYPGGPQPGNDSAAGAPNGTAVAVVDNVSDAESNSATQMIASTPGGLEIYPLGFNGATWDRLSTSSTATGLIGTLSSTAPTDGLANASVGLAGVARGGTAVAANANMGFNGTAWDRQRFGAAGYTTQTTTGVALTRPKELSTFGIGVGNSTPAATPTDIFEMCGNPSSTVQITRWEVGFTATAAPAANIVVLWVRRSSQDTGGTPNVFQPVASDPSDTGALSTARTFGSNPTTGVLVGTLKAVNITPDNILSTSDPQNIYSYVQSPGSKPWTLRGAAQCIYLNLGGANLPAGFTFTSTIETIERTDI